MLVLTRRRGDLVQIGDDIFVTVLSIKGNQVQLGFDAPKEVPILRDNAIDREPHAGPAGGRAYNGREHG